jgi:hypothetical protein
MLKNSPSSLCVNAHTLTAFKPINNQLSRYFLHNYTISHTFSDMTRPKCDIGFCKYCIIHVLLHMLVQALVAWLLQKGLPAFTKNRFPSKFFLHNVHWTTTITLSVSTARCVRKTWKENGFL